MDPSATRLLILEPGANRLISCDGNAENIQIINDQLTDIPDGIALDKDNGHIYLTQMGHMDLITEKSVGYDGSICRVNMDGSDLVTLVGDGVTRTPKQLRLDLEGQKIYWSDREGQKVMRCDLDGSGVEIIVQVGDLPKSEDDMTCWCVGMVIDQENKKFYWTQKGGSNSGVGAIYRANIDLLAGETAQNRTDIETLFKNLPEPVDLDIVDGYLYWTDRGDLPGGNSLCRAKFHDDGSLVSDHEVCVEGLGQAIGLVFDENNEHVYVASLTGELYRARLGDKDAQIIKKFTRLTGICCV